MPRWGYVYIVIIGVLGSLVRLLWGWVVMSLVPPSVEASLALTEPCCAGRSMPPVWLGRRVWT